MTQQTGNTQARNEERNYGSLWFERPSTPGATVAMKVRILHEAVGDFFQTRTHWTSFTKKDGKPGTIRVECAKKGLFGGHEEGVDCPLCAKEKFGTPYSRQWFWVQDQVDGKLKYVEMPFDVRKQIEAIQLNALGGAPLYNAVFIISKSGERLQTKYVVMPSMEHGVAHFDVPGYLHSIGLENLPALVGDKNFPPIWRLDSEGIANASNGVMPWQAARAQAYDPSGGQTYQPNAQPVAQQAVYQRQEAPTYSQPSPAYSQTAPQAVPQGTVPQAGAPNPGYSPTTTQPVAQVPVVPGLPPLESATTVNNGYVQLGETEMLSPSDQGHSLSPDAPDAYGVVQVDSLEEDSDAIPSFF